MSEDKKHSEKEVKAKTAKKDTAYPVNDLKPGMTVRVHEKIKEKGSKGEDKERIQVYEGMILTKRHSREIGATITVRKISDGIGVEKIFPLHSPSIAKIEAVKKAEVRRANLGYLRHFSKKLKEVKI
ncbi:MAG: 50S ribosomal protein L19 [Parcubacteria group bacterium]|nr:MAG: 50S ribosomal protein L19 [Parcubacteria group bacterium]